MSTFMVSETSPSRAWNDDNQPFFWWCLGGVTYSKCWKTNAPPCIDSWSTRLQATQRHLKFISLWYWVSTKTNESCWLGPLLCRHPWHLDIHCLACGNLEVSCRYNNGYMQGWTTKCWKNDEPTLEFSQRSGDLCRGKLTQTPVMSWFPWSLKWSRQDLWNTSYQRNATHWFLGSGQILYMLYDMYFPNICI